MDNKLDPMPTLIDTLKVMDKLLEDRARTFSKFPIILNENMADNSIVMCCGKGMYKRIINIRNKDLDTDG